MKKSPIIKAVIFTSIILTPLVTFAVTGTVTVQDAITGIGATAILIQLFTSTVVKALGTLALSVALLAFFYGIIEYIWAKRQGDGKGVQVGGEFMKWGLIALFVMFSVYGIIKLGQSILFQGKDVTTIDIPSFNFRTGTVPSAQNGAQSAGNNNTGGVTNSTGNNNTGGVTKSALQTCIDNGSSVETCNCEASGGIWNLTDNSCSTGSNNSVKGTKSALQTCVDNGSSVETCNCEIKGGAMGSDGVCSE